MATPRISFISHALEQMRDRGISEQDVRTTILNPRRVITESRRRARAVRRVTYQRRPYVLVVAYDRRDGKIEVITAFRTSKVEKYL